MVVTCIDSDNGPVLRVAVDERLNSILSLSSWILSECATRDYSTSINAYDIVISIKMSRHADGNESILSRNPAVSFLGADGSPSLSLSKS